MGKRALTGPVAALTAGLAVSVIAAQYYLACRNRLTTWGATADEASSELPGDDLCPTASLLTTRAIAISAPPDCVWPWLVQIGSGRAGGYSYDWIENLFGLDMHSADVILPQFQHVSQGDEFAFGRHGVMRMEIIQPGRTLALGFLEGNWVCTFALLPQSTSTRLVSRHRIALPHSWPSTLLGSLLIIPGGLLLERKMLLGIKARAERLAPTPSSQPQLPNRRVPVAPSLWASPAGQPSHGTSTVLQPRLWDIDGVG
jgi:hypothetical protein